MHRGTQRLPQGIADTPDGIRRSPALSRRGCRVFLVDGMRDRPEQAGRQANASQRRFESTRSGANKALHSPYFEVHVPTTGNQFLRIRMLSSHVLERLTDRCTEARVKQRCQPQSSTYTPGGLCYNRGLSPGRTSGLRHAGSEGVGWRPPGVRVSIQS